MIDTTTVPLNKLLAWQGNVRKTDPDKGIDELAASITAHGLLQSLVVRKDKRGKFAVVAGRRRLLALESLVNAGTVKINEPIPCSLIDDDTDAAEISLAENVQREPMHPADEFEAFKALIESGMPAADVAARFGVTETVVQKRLKLANVSPALIAAYRDGDMSLQHVMAFAVTDDHAVQERVWNELADWQRDDPESIRDFLTEDDITAQDRRVKFVTLKAYEKAGGSVRRDLFSEGEDGVFIQDAVLLESLVAKKLEKAANEARKQGWKWIEVVPAFDHDAWSRYKRLYPESCPLLPEQQAELDALTTEQEALCELDELDDRQQARFDTIAERFDELKDRPDVWPPETLAIAGAVVTLGHDGKADIRYGFVRPEDSPKTTRRATASNTDSDAPDKSTLPASLIESLTAQRSAALSAALLERADVGLAATVHALASTVFYGGALSDTPLQIIARPASLHRVEGSSAAEAIAAAAERWGERLPCNPDDLFAWCMAQDTVTLLGLLAFCAAQTLNAVVLKTDRPSNRIKHAALLADALKLDMAERFTPTAASYFGKVSKAAIIEALCEVKGAAAPAPAWSDMKKADLAALAERTVAGTGWLPDLLRTPAHATALPPEVET